LKTAIHLNFYSVSNSLWNHAYFWHGTSITFSRYLKLASFDQTPVVGNDFETMVKAEENRRCWWYVREGDM
jgi:hypothetical protein